MLCRHCRSGAAPAFAQLGWGFETPTRTLSLAERWPELPPFRFVDPALRPLLARWARGGLPLPVAVAPYVSHLAHWRAQFPDRRDLSAILSAASTYFEFMPLEQVYDNSHLHADLLRQGTTLATPPPAHDYLRPMLDYLERIDLSASVEA